MSTDFVPTPQIIKKIILIVLRSTRNWPFCSVLITLNQTSISLSTLETSTDLWIAILDCKSYDCCYKMCYFISLYLNNIRDGFILSLVWTTHWCLRGFQIFSSHWINYSNKHLWPTKQLVFVTSVIIMKYPTKTWWAIKYKVIILEAQAETNNFITIVIHS